MTDTTQRDLPTDARAQDASSGGCGCGGCGCGGGGATQETGAGARQEGLQVVAGPDRPEPVADRPAVDALVEPGDLDLRPLPRPERHATVVAAVGGLLPGEGLVLANDHDPVGLRRQLQEQDLGHLGWQYLAEGPDVWRVLVSRDTCC